MISEPLRNPLSLFEVKGKVALITGASGAFGRGCALALVQPRHAVMLGCLLAGSAALLCW